MLGRFPLGPFLLAAIARLVVLVHEIIVVAEFIFVDCDVAEGGGESVLRRSLEVLEKRFERRCMSLDLALPLLNAVASEIAPTLLRLVVDRRLELAERHFASWCPIARPDE